MKEIKEIPLSEIYEFVNSDEVIEKFHDKNLFEYQTGKLVLKVSVKEATQLSLSEIINHIRLPDKEKVLSHGALLGIVMEWAVVDWIKKSSPCHVKIS